VSKPDFRYRIHFSKIQKARFIGHLDLQDLFHKALKRSGLPVSYSQGFNPHQLVSFAAPLPLGTAGLDEIVEVYMDEKVHSDEVLSKLAPQLPSGISILRVYEIAPTGKGAAALVTSATYRIILPSETIDFDKLVQATNDILQSPCIIVTKESKKGKSEVDIRCDIQQLSCTAKGDYNELYATLSTGSARNLKPSLLFAYICDTIGIDTECIQVFYERELLLLGEVSA